MAFFNIYSKLGVACLVVLNILAVLAQPSFAANNGCVVDVNTIEWDNTGNEYDGCVMYEDPNEYYPCDWFPWPEMGDDCEVYVCFWTDSTYKCSVESLRAVEQYNPLPPIRCNQQVTLYKKCWNSGQGEAEAAICEVGKDCQPLEGIVQRAKEAQLASEFEGSTQANPMTFDAWKATCTC